MKRLGTLMAAGALLLGSCGDTPSTETVATTAADDGAATTAAPVGDAMLADYLPIFGPEDPEEAQAFWQDQERRAQELTSTCMAEQGFEYIPYSPSFEDSYYDWEATEEDRRAEQGFGMAYWLLFEEEQFEEEWNPDDDPNWAITEAMSDSEREAYYYALHGEQPEPEPDFDWENATEEELAAFEQEMERQWMEREWKGCMELGWEETSGGEDIWRSFEQEFGNMWEDVWQRAQADPRVVAVEQEWVACMADAGYTFTDQEDMWRWLDSEFESIVAWPGEGNSSGVTTAPLEIEEVQNEDGSVTYVDSDGETYTQDELDDAWAPRYDEDALRAFMEDEIAIAVAEYDCSKDMWEIQEEVQQEYEAQWVEENKAALDAWKASVEAEG